MQAAQTYPETSRRLLGKAAFKLGDAQQAQAAYRAAIAANDSAPAAWMGLAEVADATGASELAVEAYEQLVWLLLAHQKCTIGRTQGRNKPTEPALANFSATCCRHTMQFCVGFRRQSPADMAALWCRCKPRISQIRRLPTGHRTTGTGWP